MKRNFLFLLSWLTLFVLLGCGKQPMIKSPETSASISGTVRTLKEITLPPDAVAHVILADVSSPDVPRAIASQSIAQPSMAPFSFKVNYDASIINPENTYSVQVCIRFDDQLRFASGQCYPVITGGHGESVAIIVEPVEMLEAGAADSDSTSGRVGSALQQGVHKTLIGKCGIFSDRYDRFSTAKASDVLAPELISSPYHKVRETVTILGPQYFFAIDSDFGEFQAQGMARLRRLIKEIRAIAVMKEVTKSKSFKDAFAESALEPVDALKELVINPVDTVSGIPKGLWAFVTASEASVTTGRSQYEDTYIQALVTVSKYKRRYAAELKIDAYTSNPEVQKELNRLGWAAAIANWTPSVILLPASGAGKALYSAFGWTDTLNDLITETAPDLLRDRNNKKLKAMGIPTELQNRFLGHKYYSPRNHTIITEYLEAMKSAGGKAQVIEQAIQAESEIDAFTYQQIIEILAGYNRRKSAITQLNIHKGIPVGFAKNGSLVMGFPVDIGRWTPFSEYLFDDFGKRPIGSEEIKTREIWILGEFTPRTRRELGKLGITAVESADAKVGMMD
jgi:uncharacterized lipoprotein YbaY